MTTLMELNGYKARIMEAERLVGDETHGLPPGRPLQVYHVDEFERTPAHWMRGKSAFVVPVKSDKGLWFDWTMNDKLNTAILPTVKGSNPITGELTNELSLIHYTNKCPKHDVEFGPDNYCPECGYKWPVQNYVSSPNILWLDGFRSPDGNMRQFFFTEDMSRDIPSHLIGKENTVPAFGFAFFAPKEKRTGPAMSKLRSVGTGPTLYSKFSHSVLDTMSFTYCDNGPSAMGSSLSSGEALYSSDNIKVLSPEEFVEKRGIEVAIGAGAKIRQSLKKDKYELDSWKDEPDATMVIYFIFENEFEHWKSFGMKNLDGNAEGMLSGLPVG